MGFLSHEESIPRVLGRYQGRGGQPAAAAADDLLISNDLMTIGALQAIAEAGLSIPDDIAVVGFDNASWATAFRPPLTVVTQPTYEIGEVATDLLLRRVNGEQFPPRQVMLRAKLVERGSSLRLPPA